jgi:hypothetical protein
MIFLKESFEKDGLKTTLYVPLEPWSFMAAMIVDREESKSLIFESPNIVDYKDLLAETKMLNGEEKVVKRKEVLLKSPHRIVIINPEQIEKFVNWADQNCL